MLVNSNNLVIHQIIDELDRPLKPQIDQSIRATNDIDAIKTWLTEFQESPNTFISYRQTAERFLIWLIKQNLQLKDITRENIQDYQGFLTSPTPLEFWCGKSRPRQDPNWKPFVKGLAASSIKLNIQILTTMYEYLLQSGYLNRNPFRLVKRKSARLTTNRGIERYLTHKEWQYVLDYINNLPQATVKEKLTYQRTKWVFKLLYLSGCRRSEIANAKMSDFIQKHEQWWLRVIGKGNKYGEIPVTNDLLTALIEYRHSLNLPDYPHSLETDVALVNNIQIQNGQLIGISDSMLYKIIKVTCCNIASWLKGIDPAAAFVIEKVSTHWLRHTSATHQVDAGIDIRIVKENLRHSMLETTMKYQHTESDTRHLETTKKFKIK